MHEFERYACVSPDQKRAKSPSKLLPRNEPLPKRMERYNNFMEE